jgi:hypothetical protein
VAFTRRALDDWGGATGRDDPTLLLMGVTPELCGLPTAAGSRTIAIDRSRDMIRAVWPGPLRPGDAALCGEWLRLPIRERAADVILSDGCLSTLAWPEGYSAVCDELRRVVRPDGRCAMRCFVLPEDREDVETVLADLAVGRTGGFHAFKWRLAMALQPDPLRGVVLADVWEAFPRHRDDRDELARRNGWPAESVATIDAYRGVPARYSFPSLRQLEALCTDSRFAVLDVRLPGYELGERCPTIVLAPSGRE